MNAVKLRTMRLLVWIVMLAIACILPANSMTVTNGHKVLVKKGLQIQACTFPEDFGTYQGVYWDNGTFDAARFAASKFTGFYLPSNNGYVNTLGNSPGIPWSRMIRPDWLPELGTTERQYLGNLVALCLKDEQDIMLPAEQAECNTWFNYVWANCPDVIAYTNQVGLSYNDTQLQSYMAATNPDMMCMDIYPMDGSIWGTNGQRENYYNAIAKYRRVALLGNDGTGNQPIPYGMWFQTYRINGHGPTESEYRLMEFAPLTFGYKYLIAFLYDRHDDANTTWFSSLITGGGTGTPTPAFYLVAETNRLATNLAPVLVRLLSTSVGMIVGDNNVLPSGVDEWSGSSEAYLKGVSVTNTGGGNGGLTGDVLIGHFKTLDESTTEDYFMVTNALCAPDSTAAQCAQRIRLSFDFASSGITGLRRVNRNTGSAESVALVHDGGTQHHADIDLPGGEGDLFKFDAGTSAPFIGASEFWYTLKGSTTPLTEIELAQNQKVDLSLWYSMNADHNALELLVGYDTSNSAGTDATPIGNQMTLVSNLNNINPIFDSAQHAGASVSNVGGGWGASGTIRPYGAHLVVGKLAGTISGSGNPIRIADLSLRNSSIPVGSTQNVVIYNDTQGAAWQSALANGETIMKPILKTVLVVHSTESGPVTPVSVDEAKKLADGDQVAVNDMIVTAVFDDIFYIENTDRYAGIRVKKAGHGVSVGWKVSVSGVMATDPTGGPGERFIDASNGAVTGAPDTALTPLAMTNKTLGGGDFSTPPAGQWGVTGGTGTNNIGLYVRTTGKVGANIDSTSFYVDDGSGAVLKAISQTASIPDTGRYVSLTGISSCELSGGSLVRVIMLTDWSYAD